MALKSSIVLDTNIWVSALLFDGMIAESVRDIFYSDLVIVLSDYIFDEIIDVMGRKKFAKQAFDVEMWNLLQNDVETITLSDPKITTELLRDPKDHPIIQTAVESEAAFIITGDKDLLDLSVYQNVSIITLTQFTSRKQE